jgi:glycosyltransferase involved in cell wall biosynthesis
MHLTLIISSLDSGGSERNLSELANYLVSKNHQVSLVTLASPEYKPFYYLDPKVNLIQLNQSRPEFSIIRRLKNIFNRIFCLRKTIKSLKPDVILSFVDVINIMVIIATIGLNIPVIVSERTHPRYYRLPILYKKLRQFFYPKATIVIIQTQSAANYFKNLNNLFIIPNAVPKPTLVKQNIAASLPKQIVSVGRLCFSKGFDTLVYAFYKLSINYPDLTLTIYGEGSERKNLEALITSLNLQNKVYLPGAIKNIQEALIKADLFIFPSHYEGFPNALCEAMAVGLPVIASNCSGNVDIIRDGIDGRLFPIGDINALTKIALELLSDPKQCKELAENAKQVCDRFHPDRIFALWDQVVVLKASNQKI